MYCSLPESVVQHPDCNESNLYHIFTGGYRSSTISDVNANFHPVNNISNYGRSEEAGEKHVQICYDNIIPILIPTVCNHYKHNPEIHLWTKYPKIDYFENQNNTFSNIQDTSQDIDEL